MFDLGAGAIGRPGPPRLPKTSVSGLELGGVADPGRRAVTSTAEAVGGPAWRSTRAADGELLADRVGGGDALALAVAGAADAGMTRRSGRRRARRPRAA